MDLPSSSLQMHGKSTMLAACTGETACAADVRSVAKLQQYGMDETLFLEGSNHRWRKEDTGSLNVMKVH